MENLEKIRNKINEIDQKIFSLLEERKEQIKKIRKIKKILKKPIEDSQRESFILQQAKGEYEKEIFLKIIEESRKLQE